MRVLSDLSHFIKLLSQEIGIVVDSNRFLDRRVYTSHKKQGYRLVEAIFGGGHSYAYIGEPTSTRMRRERREKRVFVKIPVFSVLDEREFEVHQKVSSHPHIATVLDWGTIGRLSFLVIEYLSGGTLEEALQRSPVRLASRPNQSWSLQQRLRAFDGLCSAVKYIHEFKCLHRDIKLANILLRREEDISDLLLTDFSLARGPDSERVTIPGTEEGTPGERAPEQAHGGTEITCQVDVFGLAYVLVALSWGVQASRRLGALVESSKRGEINFEPPKNGETARLVPILKKMIARNPRERPSVAQVQKQLYRAYPQFFPDHQGLDSRQRRPVRRVRRKRRKSPPQPNQQWLINLIYILSIIAAVLILGGVIQLAG